MLDASWRGLRNVNLGGQAGYTGDAYRKGQQSVPFNSMKKVTVW